MKRLFTFLMIMACAVAAMAQAPEKFSYQAVVRDASGNLVCNGQVGVRVSILKNSANGVSVYCETHQLTTNVNGMLTLEIGGGNVVDGVFSAIDWGNGPYFVKTETDVNGGSNYTLTGTQQLLSVPYALYAKYADNDGLADRVAQLEQQVQNLTTMIGGGGSDTSDTDGHPCPGAAIVTDIDNNTYNTVKIGNQCWMKENLRTTRYADGVNIPMGSTYSFSDPYRYNPNDNANNVPTYGYLYNWPAVMHGASSSSANPSGVQGICPNGWHVPSDAEWTQLASYVGSQTQYQCDNTSGNIAKALASTTGWNSCSETCAVGNNPSTNNATGFSALPAGSYNYGFYNFFGNHAYFWSATENDGYNAYYRYLYYCYDVVPRGYDYKDYGFSVRCLRDATGSVSLPTVQTTDISNITSISAICGGNVTSDGGATVTARGVCWSTSQNPTVSNSHTTNGNGTGSFTSSITGLTAGTTYYVRAYATNSAGTAYGNELYFAPTGVYDGHPCLGAATVTDIDNNTYNTVQIGNQCWMKENLRTTRYADGVNIPMGSTYSYSDPYRYNPNDNANNVPTYGYLYNWPAVMHSASSSTVNPSGVQGICPNGWHVPSDAEWTQLASYVGSQTQYQCNNSSDNIAKALASTTGWNSSTNMCAVGNNPGTNNATGFSALPAGDYYDGYGGYYGFGSCAYFWSTTVNNYDLAYSRGLSCNLADVDRGNGLKNYGFSVRCVRD